MIYDYHLQTFDMLLPSGNSSRWPKYTGVQNPSFVQLENKTSVEDDYMEYV
jgi:hypothetical protein